MATRKRIKLEESTGKGSVVKDEVDHYGLEEKLDDIQQRQEVNRRLNAEFLQKLGVSEAKLALSETKPKPKTATKRGLKLKREPAEVLPRRSSLRLQNKTPDGIELPPEYLIQRAAYTPYTPEEHSRVASGPLNMKESLFSSSEAADHENLLKICNSLETKPAVTVKKETEKLLKTFQKLKMTEKCVAKVVPNRIFSLAIHPSANQLLVATGGKWGKLGFWNVLAEGDSPSDGVCCYVPHSRPINCLEFPHHQPEKLYSCSYDGTLRCCDLEKAVFDEVYSTDEEEGILLRNFSFNSKQTLVMSQSDGCVALVDTRTSGCSADSVYEVEDRPLRTVSVHPTLQHYIATANTAGSVSIWDVRKLKKTKNKPLHSQQFGRSVSSAYFSPVTGQYLLTTSLDDTLSIIDCSEIGSSIKLKKSIRHNNHVGRWLTNFQATWHPSREDVFISGSMKRPREIELFDDDGKLLHSFRDEDYLNSVCSLNVIHPTRPVIVGANSSGRLHVFM